MDGDLPMDSDSDMDNNSSGFVFSQPNIIPSPDKIFNSAAHSDNIFGARLTQQQETSSFIFAKPATFEKTDYNVESNQPIFVRPRNATTEKFDPNIESNKTKITRTISTKTGKVLKSSTSPFSAKEIKRTDAFSRLEKNARKRQDVRLELSNSITCLDVPESLLVRSVATEYFEQFGEVLKVTIKRKRNIIVVYYPSKEAATVAYQKAGSFLGRQFKIEWTSPELLNKPKKKETVKGKIASILNIDDEVKEELEALRGLEYSLPDAENLRAMSAAKAKLKRAAKVVANKEAPKRTLPLIARPILPKPKITQTDKPMADTSKISSLVKSNIAAIDKPNVTAMVKPKVVEKPVSKIEVQNIPKISLAAITELQNQVRQIGTTAEEKFKILDARDRLIRLKQSKQKSLATAKVTKGTCPDMCPEKERYLREFQRQLAPYEQLDSSEYKINHQYAVKQYSRSSADQEEPMAHDLRPLKSLKMTMSYLLHEIADLCERDENNLGEWYHFLWDRMRSVRKDITQQELCCVETVELVEQCARFHIMSSERLCAEEANVFDPKINSENLTKCLQSLKYMYDDLREHGIVCANEPEFRGYVILMNLNDGSFITELSNLPPAVQHSAEVKFGLEAYSAIAMNNYSKFFKLVRKTTYLNGCILMRYFNQVRLKALQVMVKAYCRTSGTTEYPLYELIDILGFEDEDEAHDTCARVGLKCDRDSLYIKLNKEKFRHPESNLEQGRAYNLVLSKRLAANQSVGQCIAGGVWPEKFYENHKPHCSFDDRGYLLPSSINAQDQSLVGDPYEFVDDDSNDVQFVSEQKPQPKIANNVEDTKQTTIPVVRTPTVVPASSSSVSSTFSGFKSNNSSVFASAPSAPSIFAPAVPSIFTKPASTVFSTALPTKPPTLPTSSVFTGTENKNLFSSGTGQNTNLFKPPSFPIQQPAVEVKRDTSVNVFGSTSSTVKSTTAAVAVTTSSSPGIKSNASIDRIATKRHMEEPLNVAEKKALTEKEEMLRKQLELKRKMKAEQERLELLERVNLQAAEAYKSLLDEVVKETCAEVARNELDRLNRLSEEIYDEVVAELCENVLRDQLFIQDALMEVESRLRERLIMKYFRAWKQWVVRRRAHRREALDNTPVWLQPTSLEETARKLYRPQQQLAIDYARECRRRKSLTKLQEKLETEDGAKKLPRHAPIEFIVYVGLQENAKSLEVEIAQHNFWKMVISWPLLENRLTLWRHKKLVNKYLSPQDYTLEPIIIRHKPSPQENLDICIRYFEGLICDNCLTGTDALLFIVSADEDEHALERRLVKSVMSREKLMPIPLVVLVFGDEITVPKPIKASIIEKLMASGHISEYTILYERSIDENVVLRIFQSAALWLAINKSPAVPLEMDYLKRIFEDCLAEELWLRIQSYLSPNPKLSKALDDPNFIINLHNEAITHITDIILDPESLNYTDFSPELKIYLKNKPTYPRTYEYFDSVWKHPEYRAELERIMNSFIFPSWKDDWPITNSMEFYNAIVDYCNLIIPREHSVSVTNDIMSDMFLIAHQNNEEYCPSFIDVLLHVMARKIADVGGNTRVVYNKNHIKHFQTLPWWFKSNTLLEYVAQHENENDERDEEDSRIERMSQNITMTSETRLDLDFECDIDELNETCQQQEEEQPVKEVCREVRGHLDEVKSIADKLEKQLEEQRLRSQEYEKKLMEALNDDFLNDVI